MSETENNNTIEFEKVNFNSKISQKDKEETHNNDFHDLVRDDSSNVTGSIRNNILLPPLKEKDKDKLKSEKALKSNLNHKTFMELKEKNEKIRLEKSRHKDISTTKVNKDSKTNAYTNINTNTTNALPNLNNNNKFKTDFKQEKNLEYDKKSISTNFKHNVSTNTQNTHGYKRDLNLNLNSNSKPLKIDSKLAKNKSLNKFEANHNKLNQNANQNNLNLHLQLNKPNNTNSLSKIPYKNIKVKDPNNYDYEFSDLLEKEFSENINSFRILARKTFLSKSYVETLNATLLKFAQRDENYKIVIKSQLAYECENLKKILFIINSIDKNEIIREKSLAILNEYENMVKSNIISDSTGQNYDSNSYARDNNLIEGIKQCIHNFKLHSYFIVNNYIVFREITSFDFINTKYDNHKFKDILRADLLLKVKKDIEVVKDYKINSIIDLPFFNFNEINNHEELFVNTSELFYENNSFSKSKIISKNYKEYSEESFLFIYNYLIKEEVLVNIIMSKRTSVASVTTLSTNDKPKKMLNKITSKKDLMKNNLLVDDKHNTNLVNNNNINIIGENESINHEKNTILTINNKQLQSDKKPINSNETKMMIPKKEDSNKKHKIQIDNEEENKNILQNKTNLDLKTKTESSLHDKKSISIDRYNDEIINTKKNVNELHQESLRSKVLNKVKKNINENNIEKNDDVVNFEGTIKNVSNIIKDQDNKDDIKYNIYEEDKILKNSVDRILEGDINQILNNKDENITQTIDINHMQNDLTTLRNAREMLDLKFFTGKISDLEHIYEKFKNSKDFSEQVEIFDYKESIYDYQFLTNPKIVLFNSEKANDYNLVTNTKENNANDANEYNNTSKKINERSNQGFAIISFREDTNTKNYSLIIENLTIQEYLYTEILSKLIDFLKENLAFTEILVELKYSVIDSKLVLNKKIKKYFDDLKFKWKNVVNHGDIRKTRLGLNVIGNQMMDIHLIHSGSLNMFSNNIISIHSKDDVDEDQLNKRILYEFKLDKTKNGNLSVRSINDDFEVIIEEKQFLNDINYYFLSHLISEIELKKKLIITTSDIKKLTNEKQRKAARSISVFTENESEEVMDYLKNLYFVKKSEASAKILSENLLISNTFNLRFCVNNKFKSKSSICRKVFLNSLQRKIDVIYNRIIVENFEVMKSDMFPNVNFYLLKNSLDDSTLLIFDYIDESLKEMFNSSMDKYQTIHEIQKSLNPIKSESNKIFYLPSFKSSKFSIISPNNIPKLGESNITTKDRSEEFTFTQFLNESNITFDPDLDYKFTFDLANNETNYTLLSNDFAICYINLSVLNEIGIETVFMTEIKEIEFITV